jgi:hypothetical protein
MFVFSKVGAEVTAENEAGEEAEEARSMRLSLGKRRKQITEEEG